MSTSDEKYRQENNRRLGIFIVDLIWGMAAITLLIHIAQNMINNHPSSTKSIVLLIVAIVTIAGSLLGDVIRRIVGWIWLITMVIGLIMLIVGDALGIQDVMSNSLIPIVLGAMSGIFLNFSEFEQFTNTK